MNQVALMVPFIRDSRWYAMAYHNQQPQHFRLIERLRQWNDPQQTVAQIRIRLIQVVNQKRCRIQRTDQQFRFACLKWTSYQLLFSHPSKCGPLTSNSGTNSMYVPLLLDQFNRDPVARSTTNIKSASKPASFRLLGSIMNGGHCIAVRFSGQPFRRSGSLAGKKGATL